MSRRLLVALVACSLLALLSTAEYCFWLHVVGRPVATAIAPALLREGLPWILWAFCVPLVIAWGERFTLSWPPRATIVLAHVAGAAGAIALFALSRSIGDYVFKLAPAPTEPFWHHLRNSLVYSSPTGTITYGATLGLGYAASYHTRARELAELRGELSKAQLSALRMQLNPHFFFNTLHTIGALVRDENPKDAVELIERLGDVLRHVLRPSDELETQLRDEIAFLRKYLEIEQVRFGERLCVRWEIEPRAESVRVPQLIVQPLVENALRHGISPRARGGAITIAARVDGDAVELRVADDGVGLPPEGTAAHAGLGLENVRVRLLQTYGAAARLSLRPGHDGGVDARILLPLANGRSGDGA